MGRWLLLPIAVLDWVALTPQPVVVIAFLLAVAGMAGMAAALVVRMLHRSRGAMAGLGVTLLDPLWPDAITHPQVVGSAYWKTAGLGVELAGFALLATLLVAAATGRPAPRGH